MFYISMYIMFPEIPHMLAACSYTNGMNRFEFHSNINSTLLNSNVNENILLANTTQT